MSESSTPEQDVILEIKNLKTYFFMERSIVRAINGVSLKLTRNTTLGLVGESGCGKSVLAQSVMRLIQSPPGKIVDGEIWLYRDGKKEVNIVDLDPRGMEMRNIRGGDISIVFQEPMTSLNPLFTIGDQIAEAIELHQKVDHREALERALEMLTKVQISEPERRLKSYPHQLSGGMRQRAMIALALSCNPTILFADEPTTALDVTVQAQILDLMNQLKDDFHSTIVLITHNLGVVSQMTSKVAVMYLGEIVEFADTRDLFHEPMHPYSVGLLNSVPVLGRKGQKILIPIPGMVPTPTEIIPGCPFQPRCDKAMSICRERQPNLLEHKPGRLVACWLYEDETI
ncbi:MAG TPA: dipeptide/oligopeptide/nickel ABC transporter ATP-binding protein [Chloroflexi bacterium]|nr:dipeptide/oligopeptide/nickel ABC transporter ATP-binding protein [Chloroflexota bacterium]